MMMRTADKLAEPLGLTASRWMLLCTIGKAAEAPRSIAELSDDIRLSPQNISRMATVMEEEGLLERKRPATGGRQVLLTLTERGQSVLEATHDLADRFNEHLMRGIDDEHILRVIGDLRVLIDNVAVLETVMAEDKTEQPRAESQD